MAIRDNYGYENARYAMLKQPSIDVTSAFGRAMDDSPPGSSVHTIFQARILEWVASKEI